MPIRPVQLKRSYRLKIHKGGDHDLIAEMVDGRQENAAIPLADPS